MAGVRRLMYPNPNPVAAVQAVLREHATPTPKAGPYDSGWDGKHCAFIYTAATLLDWPAVPELKQPEGLAA